jgi:K+-dependent Na+/Ca+ exchanger-like protein
MGMFFIAIAGLAVFGHLHYGGDDAPTSSRLTGRHLLSEDDRDIEMEKLTCASKAPESGSIITYPIEAKGGPIILYVLGVMYMFVALAIVCDEFFVPALEELMEVTGVSDDVGGATFMAAGGSAPELFTSLIGTFGESSVGFGTIVGSAVFNVLFVIGMCAFFSKDLLKLTWWPLARDVSYYACGLIVLAIFFEDQTIELWEACVLFAGYWGYVFVMSKNAQLHAWFTKPKKGTGDAKINPGDTPTGEGGKTENRRESNVFSMYENQLETKKISAFLHPRTFRDSVLQLWLQDKKVGVMDKVRYLLVSSTGNVDKTFDTIDADKSGFIDSVELKTLLSQLLPSCTDEDVQLALKELDTSDDDRISKDEFKRWYKDSQLKLEAIREVAMKEVRTIFDSIDKDSSGTIDKTEILDLMTKVNHVFAADPTAKQAELDVIWNEAIHVSPEKITYPEFEQWYKGSVAFKEHTERQIEKDLEPDEGEEDEGGMVLEWPSGLKAQIMFIILFPLMGSLMLTVPDVRKAEKKKWYPLSFFLSIFWIGIYSFFMVEWAGVIGQSFGIPPAVMGVTFLAAGTSIPDLMTSVIVARQGLGDMAVSSSIGSNIFDILVGLPVPWILYSASKGGAAVSVQADTIPVSIVVLFLMLICVVSTIALSGWTMTKTLGSTMFCLYGVFLIQDLLRACMPSNKMPQNFIKFEPCECNTWRGD